MNRRYRITTGPETPRKPYDPTVPSYVYRIYDEFGRLLYIGCSVNPLQRLHGHDGKDWFDYARKVDVRGPWPRTMALQIEADAIASEAPFFNCQPEHTRTVQANRREAERRMLSAGWVRFSKDIDAEDGEDWYDAHARYCIEARDTHPVVDDDERLRRYLAQREFCEQAAS